MFYTRSTIKCHGSEINYLLKLRNKNIYFTKFSVFTIVHRTWIYISRRAFGKIWINFIFGRKTSRFAGLCRAVATGIRVTSTEFFEDEKTMFSNAQKHVYRYTPHSYYVGNLLQLVKSTIVALRLSWPW